jgi:hypothetical protein
MMGKTDSLSTCQWRRPGRFEQILLPVVLLALVGGGTGLWWIVSQESRRPIIVDDDGPAVESAKKLEEAREKADRLDPGWRFGDLLAHRTSVPGEKNGALAVLKAQDTLKVPWSQEELSNDLIQLASLDSLSAKQVAALKEALIKDAPALREASRLADLPTGRYPVDWKEPDPLLTPLPHLATIIAVQQVLFCDALRHTQNGDLDEALKSTRALLNAGRSIGDEPTLHSQVIRVSVHLLAAQALERILAHGQPTDGALKETQVLFEDEGAQPLLLRAARACRAGREDLLDILQESRANLDFLDEVSDDGGNSLADLVTLFFSNPGTNQPSLVRGIHAWLLNYLTEFVEIARLPQDQQAARLQTLLSSIQTCPKAGRALIPTVGKIVEAFNNSQAFMRCSAAAMAIERFRQTKGAWPEDLNALVPAYLAAVPIDPHDGKRVCYRKYPEGVVVYSVGADSEDNGGNFETLNTYRAGTDLGIRLWDPAKRTAAKPQK